MSGNTLGLRDDVRDYVLRWGFHEHPLLAKLRDETASHRLSMMQIAPEQGAMLGMLVEILDVRRYLEIGVFTGYSSLAVALAMPSDGTLVCCDVSDEFTQVARRYWAEAGVADRVDLRLAPAIETLDGLIANGQSGTFDLALIDADKPGYLDYYERVLELLRPGGIVAVDNVLWSGRVAEPDVQDPDTRNMRAVNERIAADDRVRHVLLPVADGMTLARKR